MLDDLSPVSCSTGMTRNPALIHQESMQGLEKKFDHFVGWESDDSRRRRFYNALE